MYNLFSGIERYKGIKNTHLFLQKNVDLSKFCFYKTGGYAQFFGMPQLLDDLLDLLAFAKQNNLKYHIFGVGSNVLFAENTLDGLVISLRNLNKWVYFDGEYFHTGAGVLLDDFIKFTMNFGFSKLVYLSGIPGSVGGALYMNAGAFGAEIKDFVEDAEILCDNGEIKRLRNSEIDFAYRQAKKLINNIVLSTRIKLSYLPNKLKAYKVRNTVLHKRQLKQPLEYPSCGSVFKRGSNYYAGALIEECGLKGCSAGDCEVSKKHANFIINKGHATSDDIYKLILHVKEEVYKKFGITLEEELKFIGF
jgi:UDP-N-acetylmuramate dehydrogenase